VDVPLRRQRTQPIHENPPARGHEFQLAAIIPANPRRARIVEEPVDDPGEEVDPSFVDEDENMPEAPLPGAPSAPSVPANPAAADAYNLLQSNLSLARECLATVIATLQPRNPATYGEVQSIIPTIRDIDLFISQTNVTAQTLMKKCISINKYIGQAIDQSTKVAQRNYAQRVGGEEARELQRRQNEIARQKALINQRREELRREEDQLRQQEADLRPRRTARQNR